MNISCFGASVTAQKEGYVMKLTELLESCNVNVIQKGYGGMHLFNAGIVFLNEVIKEKPNICLIDWFSTGYIFEECTFLDTIIYSLCQIHCIPIFLFLDRKDILLRKNMYIFCKDYAKKNNINYIELHDIWDKEIILRDMVHTTILGAEKYAEYISQFLKNEIFPNMQMCFDNIICPVENKYCIVKKIDINKIVNTEIQFSGNGEIIGIYQTIGPHSGKLKYIYYNDQDIEKEQEFILWDRWCHYERKTISNHIDINGKFKIIITQEDFDKSIANKQIEWNNYVNYMNIISIFYIGDIEIIKIF
jgi:hypothetical protein